MSLVLPLALFAVLAAVLGVAAISYHRLQARRFRLLRDLGTADVFLEVRRSRGAARAVDRVDARILTVDRDANRQAWVEVFVYSIEGMRPWPLVPPPPIPAGSTGWLPLQDVLSVETNAGVVHRF